MAGEKVNLAGAKETLLMTLYGKALESRMPHSLLGDRFADEAVRKIDYDFSRLKVDKNLGIGLAIRAKTLDVRVEEFLARNPGAIVLHLGCGLDTRIFRVGPPPGVDWFDVDYPEVIELRRKLYPPRDRYRLIASSVTEPDWLVEVPRNRPAIVVAEGLTPYLPAEEGFRLFSRLVIHLAGGDLIFDAYSGFGLKLLRLNPAVKATGAEVHWAIEDPHELELAVPKLRFIEDIPAYRPEHAARMGWSAQLFVRLWKHIPALRKIGRLLRYRF
ncbi:class I SAM-dependent methyltransferase [Mesorhizobium sp. B292B1B]|uniref:class I SAM-dependent methyltransferase n=1 Tax=unclassified Mesorhizobium TaxID=325217 RepID=UPI00112EB5EB|nr:MULTISPECIES: class I SAM-dependent methyltransferase [unclassified Mesorhizobium]MCA0011013.1 class I SAM-dependent methyltransferase [Mesorhizobium sp. B294B1A1]MCA0035793.1 class I SAM-dependent methyltransferase [Mesorhizobium sp. B292B1B]TPM48904.1 class I SAM-dependent methyltransferase [Mesorhizobium sp. B2-3-2]